MARLARIAVALAVLAFAPGCVATTHMYPDAGPRHWNDVQWNASFDKAHEESVQSKKPILLIIAAGAKDGYC